MTPPDQSDTKLFPYIAMRIADLPEPYVPSTRLRCEDCKEPVWVSNENVGFALDGNVLCVKCARLLVKP